eukprot:Platyproteum_vivax@DN7065_c0_g1_i1.p1
MQVQNRFRSFAYIFYNTQTKDRAVVRTRFQFGHVPGCRVGASEVDGLIGQVQAEGVVHRNAFLIYRIPFETLLAIAQRPDATCDPETCRKPSSKRRLLPSPASPSNHLLMAINHLTGAKVLAPSQNRLARHLGVRQAKISEMLSKQSGSFQWGDWLVVRVSGHEYKLLQAAKAAVEIV